MGAQARVVILSLSLLWLFDSKIKTIKTVLGLNLRDKIMHKGCSKVTYIKVRKNHRISKSEGTHKEKSKLT